MLFLQINFVNIISKDAIEPSVKGLESDLESFDLNDKDNNDSCVTIQKENKTEDETLTVLFNKHLTVEFSKEKLLEKSEYFRAITSSRFNDSKNNYIEVNFEASTYSFNKY